MNSDKQLTKVTHQWFLMLIITVVIASVFYLYQSIIVKNIGNIQFSQNLEDFNVNVSASIDNIKPNTYYDFLFIVGYSILFYLSYRVFQSSIRIPVSKLWILLCFLPGLFDIVENLLLLNLLNNSENSLSFNVFWLVVRIKWTFIIPFVLINFTILIYYLIRILTLFLNNL